VYWKRRRSLATSTRRSGAAWLTAQSMPAAPSHQPAVALLLKFSADRQKVDNAPSVKA
jgi:hypothetical protein